MKKFIIVGMLIMLIMLATLTPTIAIFKQVNDKLTHVVFYCVVTCAVFYIFRIQRYYIFSLSILIMGMCTELIHLLVPYRDFEYADIVANTIGSCIGFIFITIKEKKYVWNSRNV